MREPTKAPRELTGFLAWIERSGNRLPDPVFLFLWCIGAVVMISAVCAMLGVSALHPTQLGPDGQPLLVSAQSLVSADNIRRLLVEMPATVTGFHPLGYVLVVMLGAGVAERSGLFGSAMTAAVSRAPKALLTPAVALVAMLGNLAADAAYVVLIPLAGVIFAAAGRHPIAGIAAAFAGVSGGFSANLSPGQLDALLFGITEAAAETLDSSWNANIAGNWYFISGMTVVFLPVIWWLTDRVIEPRLAPLNQVSSRRTDDEPPQSDTERSGDREMRALRAAGVAALVVIGIWILLCFLLGTPLIDESAAPEARFNPLYQSLVAGFFILFLASGWAYGQVIGSVSSHRDIVKMMSAAMADLSYYLVLAFAAAHFVAMFNWSNLGLILAINGAALLQSVELPISVLMVIVILFTALINLFVGSASAKWGLLAPLLVPMLMLTGISPEMSTAAYRVGDGATNIITPLMPYFPLILVFCQRWKPDFGMGSLAATMLPYSLWLLISGALLTVFWVVFQLPLGPAASVQFSLP